MKVTPWSVRKSRTAPAISRCAPPMALSRASAKKKSAWSDARRVASWASGCATSAIAWWPWSSSIATCLRRWSPSAKRATASAPRPLTIRSRVAAVASSPSRPASATARVVGVHVVTDLDDLILVTDIGKVIRIRVRDVPRPGSQHPGRAPNPPRYRRARRRRRSPARAGQRRG